MKQLILHCECGQTATVRGQNVDEIMAAIDAASWQDLPDDDGKHPRGHSPGRCPACIDGEEALQDAVDEESKP